MKGILLHMLSMGMIISMLGCMGSESMGGPSRKLKDRESYFTTLRMQMVATQIESRGVKDKAVLKAMRKVKRHLFVLPEDMEKSYSDFPLPIGENQTISQPYIVAFMTELLELDDNSVVLEIGTGSGYQAAVLAEIAQHVYTIEIIDSLTQQAKKLLSSLGYKNITVKTGDGYMGWPEHAPFEGIIVTAAPNHIPQPLVDQLKVGGKMVIPVGNWYQELLLIEKMQDGIKKKNIIPVRFVPMTGKALEKKK